MSNSIKPNIDNHYWNSIAVSYETFTAALASQTRSGGSIEAIVTMRPKVDEGLLLGIEVQYQISLLHVKDQNN